MLEEQSRRYLEERDGAEDGFFLRGEGNAANTFSDTASNASSRTAYSLEGIKSQVKHYYTNFKQRFSPEDVQGKTENSIYIDPQQVFV